MYDPHWKRLESVDKKKEVIYGLKQIWLEWNMTCMVCAYFISSLSENIISYIYINHYII